MKRESPDPSPPSMICTSLASFVFLNIDDMSPSSRSARYIDEFLIDSGAVSQAGIYSYPDGSRIASSGNVAMSDITFQHCFERPTSFFPTGVLFNGVKYMTLRASERTVFAQKGASGVFACRTEKSVVVGVYNDQADPSVAFEAVEALAEFLRSRE